jgi:amino acid transporter
MEQATKTGLVRGIRRWDLVAVAVNNTISASIFGLPSKLYGLSGTYSLLAFLICAIIITLIILCFAEVGSRFSQSGGPYLYARETFSPAVGFEVGWLMWLARLTAFATNCNLLVSFLGYFWPAASSGLWRVGVICVVVVSLTTVNIIGVRETAIATDLFTIGKLIPLALFIGVGLFFVNPQNYSLAAQPTYNAFWTSVLLLIYSFSGFEYASIPAGEVHDPRRNVPFACLITLGGVALIYLMIQFVCIGTLPGLASSERPLTDASSQFLGVAGAAVISAGALISITGGINGIVLASSRLLFAMSEQHQLPRLFSATSRRFRTPHFAILLSASIMLVLTISSTFIYALTISTLIRLITYAATCAALLILRRTDDARPALFKAPGGVAISVIALGLIAWLLSNSTWREARDVVIAAAAGLPLFMLYRLTRRGSRSGQELDVADPLS